LAKLVFGMNQSLDGYVELARSVRRRGSAAPSSPADLASNMGVSLEKWRKLPKGLTSHFRLFHVAYDSLPTVIDVDVRSTASGTQRG